MDFLACPNCADPYTCGEFCNLTCRRAWLRKINPMRIECGEEPILSITAQDGLRMEYEEYQHRRPIPSKREARKARFEELLKIVDTNTKREPGWMCDRVGW